MYGTFSGMSFGLIAGAVIVVIALAIMFSPLFAVILALIAGFFLLIGMSALRRRSRAAEQTNVSEPGTGPAGARARGTSGRRASGAPASGEGS
jgi:membrane protein implicated in regulation of membrane protease activity